MTDDSSNLRAALSRAIQILLRPVHLDRLWSAQGPTAEAVHIRRALGRPLTGTERLLVLAAFDLWDQKGGASFGEIVERFEAEHLERLFSVALAVKLDDKKAFNEWLLRFDRELDTPKTQS